MFRLFQHLVPRALAWSTTAPTRLRQCLEGLAAGVPTAVRAFVDLVYLDLFPTTTRELAAWERQFALGSGGSDSDRRAKLDGAWRLQGGQSPDYLQRTLHAAGFTNVYVHEWWSSGPPYVARDPRDFITQPLIGIYQCEPSSQWECFSPEPGQELAPHCDDTLANDPGYFVTLDLTRRSPPPVPDDPSRWPYFVYFSAETFPELASVPASRVAELKELISRIAPAQQWKVMLIFADDELGDGGFGSGGFGSSPFGA